MAAGDGQARRARQPRERQVVGSAAANVVAQSRQGIEDFLAAHPTAERTAK